MSTIETRSLVPTDLDACEHIAMARPVRFGEEIGLQEIRDAIREREGMVAVRDGEVIGFLTFIREDPRSAQIVWLGVQPELADDVDRALVEDALTAFADTGSEIVCVVLQREAVEWTLYASLGFVPLCTVFSIGDTTDELVVLGRALTPR